MAASVLASDGQQQRFLAALRHVTVDWRNVLQAKGERRSMSEADYAGLITAAHTQLPAPLILIWDKLNTHVSATIRTFIEAHDQVAHRRPAAGLRTELNPVEGAWANIKNSLGNLGSCRTPGRLAATMKNRLKRIQCRPALIDGFLAQTGLSIQPEPP